MDYKEQILEIRKTIQEEKYGISEEKLLSLISNATIKNVEDENNTYYSFNNYIETLIFWNIYKPEKKNVMPDINYAEVYYYLGFINIKQKNYGKAIEYLEKGLQWNPIDVTLIIERATVYRMLGEIERYKAEIEKTHSLIYRSFDMARFYAELGWYYVEKRIFDLGNALYTKSLEFSNTELAKNELMFIAKQENRELRFSSKEEIKKLFADYNIWSGFNRNTVNLIYEEYKRLGAYKPQPSAFQFLKQTLYDITLDEQFKTHSNTPTQQNDVDKNINEDFTITKINEEYAQNKLSANLVKMLHIFSDSIINENKQDPFWTDTAKNVLEIIVVTNLITKNSCSKSELELQIKDTNIIRKTIKENLEKLSIPELNGIMSSKSIIDSEKPFESVMDIIRKALSQQNSSIEEKVTTEKPQQVKKDNSELQELIIKYNKYEIQQDEFINCVNKIKQQLKIIRVFKITNGEVKDGMLSQGSQLTELLWKTDSGLGRICFTSFEQSSANKPNFETVAMPDEFMNIVKDCIKANQKLTINMPGNDDSIGIPPETLKLFISNDNVNEKVTNQKTTEDDLKEYSQEIPNYPTFKFYFPQSMGEYVKQKDNIFELKKDNIQKIRVMISKCSSEENLEADAKKWIEFNKKETNMEDVSYKKEKINNIPIEVYELKKIGKNGTRIYKIGYVNGCRITISGGNVDGKEEIINKAFEKITWIDSKSNNEKKVDETNKTKTPIIVDCPACKNNFELKWNIPATEKTFYCKCPNCGMELKRGNPNYKGAETTANTNNNKDKIIAYLINVLKLTEKRALSSFEYLNQHEDILNEFANCINGEQFNYCDNGIIVEGYSAKSLKEEVGNKLSDLGVYNYLIYLRNNPNEAKQNLEAGLPRK